LNAVGRTPWPEITKQLENLAPGCLPMNELATSPALPEGLKVPKRSDIRHHQIGDRGLVVVICFEFFLIDKFKARDTLDGRCERANRAANFEDEQPFRRERGRVRSQFKAGGIAIQHLGETLELGREGAYLSDVRKRLRFRDRPWSSGGTRLRSLRL
jgi:hypothetical protein